MSCRVPKPKDGEYYGWRITVMMAGFEWFLAYDEARETVLISRSATHAIAEGQACYPVAIASWNGDGLEVRKWFPVRGYQWKDAHRGRDLALLAETLRIEMKERRG
jgi:hypothetical protein